MKALKKFLGDALMSVRVDAVRFVDALIGLIAAIVRWCSQQLDRLSNLLAAWLKIQMDSVYDEAGRRMNNGSSIGSTRLSMLRNGD